MIRTLETACNNNISHPSLLHKPFLFLDQARKKIFNPTAGKV